MEFTATTAWAPRRWRRRETSIGGENQRVFLLYGTLLAVPRCDSLRSLGWQLSRGGWLNTRFLKNPTSRKSTRRRIIYPSVRASRHPRACCVLAYGRATHAIFLLSRRTEQIIAVFRHLSDRRPGLGEWDML
ncbi:hypothetical protein MRX96_005555 [Rhipicephalus microplus]